MEGEHNNNVVLLSPESQLLLSMIGKKSELPSYVDGTLNEAVNDIANEVLRKVRKSIVDILFVSKIDEPNRRNRERGLTKTIVDKDWHKTEKRIETAIRFFPDVVVEQRGGYYPIQWMVMCGISNDTKRYNLMSVSLITLIIKFAFEFRQFEENRGGLLCRYSTNRKWNTLQQIICYCTNNFEDNKLLDDCFSTVRNWMREHNYLVNKDIHQYNLVGKMFVKDTGSVSESRLRYLTDIDPVSLSIPCFLKQGNGLPIHYSFSNNNDIQVFSCLLNAGMQYYPEKFGFIFQEGIHRNDEGKLVRRWTPYQFACGKYGQEKVTKLVMNCIQEYICSSASSTSTNAAPNYRERSLLLAIITDKLVHRDALYLLLRNDPIAALSKIQQQVLRVVGDDDGQTTTDTNTNTNANTNTNTNTKTNTSSNTNTNTNTNTSSNNIKSKNATDTIAAAAAVSASMTMTMTTITTAPTPTTTTTVSSPPPATAAPTRDALAIIPDDDGQTGTDTNTNTNSNDNKNLKGTTETIAAAAAVSASMTTTAAPMTTTVFDFVIAAISASMTTTAASTTTTATVSLPPPAAAALTSTDSLAIIPFQASMDPTVFTSSNNASNTTSIPSDSNDTLPD